MKTTAFSLTALFLSLLLLSCEKEDLFITPSSQITTESISITDFDELSISDPFEVLVQFTESGQALQVEANSNLQPYIEVRQDNDRLTIELDDKMPTIKGTPVLKVFLSVDQFKSLTAEGAAKVYLQNNWNATSISVQLSGASLLEGPITANQLLADLSGASDLVLEGAATLFEIKAEGACQMSGFDFEADELDADLSGASHLTLRVNELLSVTASGGSTVTYQGDGTVQFQDLSGGSQIIKE
jgi:hypothetical protein